jgi:hypothetical protein
VNGVWTDLLDHLVDDTSVSKGASSHDLVVASASTVGVEVLLLHVTFIQVTCGR